MARHSPCHMFLQKSFCPYGFSSRMQHCSHENQENHNSTIGSNCSRLFPSELSQGSKGASRNIVFLTCCHKCFDRFFSIRNKVPSMIKCSIGQSKGIHIFVGFVRSKERRTTCKSTYFFFSYLQTLIAPLDK